MKYFKKPTTYMVLGFILLFAFFLSKESKAETIIELAPSVAYSGKFDKHFALMAHERLKDKYDVGVILLIDLERENGNRGIEALRVAKYKNWEAGIGWAFWANEQSKAWNARQTFSLSLGYRFDKYSVRWRHWSTGGTSSRNAGMDMLTFGVAF